MSAKQRKKKNAHSEMSIIGHISELRSRLIVVVTVAFLSFIVCFSVIRPFADELLAMGRKAGFEFVYLSPSELLTSYFSLSFIAAIIITSPVILYELWLYIAPALDDRCQKAGRLALALSFFFFAAGSVFAYTVSLPFMIRFLVEFNTSPYISSSISVQNYLNFFVGIIMVFGLIFEMPILSYTLSMLGILKPAYIRKARQFAIPLIFLMSAFMTPPDVVSQFMVAIPMIILYEISIGISAIVKRKKDQAEEADEAEETA